jgi:CubicO group peptidase (beta-lactamase class C family)
VHNRFIAVLFLLGLLACSGNEKLAPRKNEPGGRPANATQGAPGDLSAVLEPIRAKHGLPAMAAAVVRGTEVVALGATGVRRAGGTERVTSADKFHLGSCTKAITATMLATLVEEGKLTWDATVADALPHLGERIHPQYRGATLRQLLTNTSGAPEELRKDGLWLRLRGHQGTPTEARRLLTETVLSWPPEHAPGTKYEYSNAGFSIAGYIAEHVTGSSWEDLVRARIFEPLGMESAGFGPPGSADTVDQPRGHHANGTAMDPGPFADNPIAIAPANHAHASLSDWADFAIAHMRGAQGHDVLVPAATYQVLHTPTEAKPKAGVGYAMGWLVVDAGWAGGTVLNHAGSNTLWYAAVVIAPRKDFAVLVATNQGGPAAARATDATVSTLIRKYVIGE